MKEKPMAGLCRSKGSTRIEVILGVVVGLVVLACAVPALHHLRRYALRASCCNNLSAIGKAMLLYANDHNGEFPHAGGRTTSWGSVANWIAPERAQAFGTDARGYGGAATISSCFYLLVKYMGLEPRTFVCPGDKGTFRMTLSDLPVEPPSGFKLADGWDFGPEAYRHCSYAYHFPFGLYALKASDEPAMPLAADRNPWLDSPAGAAADFSLFNPDLTSEGFSGTTDTAKNGNCLAHQLDGQNVMFLDTHVTFEKRAYCSLEDDNIYTVSQYTNRGEIKGQVPVPPTVNILSRRDSVLVHDPPRLGATSGPPMLIPPAQEVDSKGLKQTAVVATLDCPVPEHKNAIWCSTFQMAWDKLRKDIIAEPIRLPGAVALAGRLNRTEFPLGAIEDRSYYAAAGLVQNGIIEQIQREMAKRFPSEPAPTFERGWPDDILAYAYLNVCVEFECPYDALSSEFGFRDSNDKRTGVIAFCVPRSVESGQQMRVRQQVHILYYENGESPVTAEFAVDLSHKTQPYQVVLACMPRCTTLREAVQRMQEKSTRFMKNADYDSLCKLQSIDTLTVPDVAYKLTHSFNELLGKSFGNAKWRGYSFCQAMQKIDFSLTRTGVVLKSEARIRATRGGPVRVEKPRHFSFDRPFLICVQKREPNATPFFLMWVDNAELMKTYGDQSKP